MATVEKQGAVLDDVGAAINGATVNMYDINTTTPSRANTTTDSSGLWDISHATRGAYDVKIVNGTDVIWLRARDRVQFSRLELFESEAGHEALIVTRSEDAAEVEVTIFEGDRATPADGDSAYNSYMMSDSGGIQEEVARVTWTQFDINPSADGGLKFSIAVAGSLTDTLDMNATAGGVLTNNFKNGRVLIDDVTDASSGTDGSLQTDGGLSVVKAAFIGTTVTADSYLASADDSGALGASGTAFADLFLASGAVINFNAGDVTLTHASNAITVDGGDLLVANGFGLIVGHTAQIAATGITPELQVLGIAAADASFLLGRFSADAGGSELVFVKGRDAIGATTTALSDNDEIGRITFVGVDAVSNDFENDAAFIAAQVDGTPGTNDMPGRLVFSVSPDGSALPAEALRIDNAGDIQMRGEAELYIGPAAVSGGFTDANVTVGLTINQEANDDTVIALKSSDVVHALLTAQFGPDAETDTYLSVAKSNAGEGGVIFQAIGEDAAVTDIFRVEAYGGTATTTKDESGRGLINFYAAEHDGSNAVADVTADGIVFSVRGRVGGGDRSLFLIDEDGDLFADSGTSTNAVTVYDEFDDLSLVRAFQQAQAASGGRGLVQTEWDDFVTHNEADLVDLGILGAPIAKGGLVNVTGLQRLHNGAISQLGNMLREVVRVLTPEQKKMLPASLTGE